MGLAEGGGKGLNEVPLCEVFLRAPLQSEGSEGEVGGCCLSDGLQPPDVPFSLPALGRAGRRVRIRGNLSFRLSALIAPINIAPVSVHLVRPLTRGLAGGLKEH